MRLVKSVDSCAQKDSDSEEMSEETLGGHVLNRSISVQVFC